jgi:deoxyribonuclease-4
MELVITDTLRLGADTFQIFIRNNRNMKQRQITPYEISCFNHNLLKSDLTSFVVHAAYAMNPCTSDVYQRERLKKIISADLHLMNEMAGIKYYVLHPGSAKDLSTKEALDNLALVLHDIKQDIGSTHIALEFMSGAGTQMLSTPEQIIYIMSTCYDIPHLCICFDTCHVYAAGYNLWKTYDILKQYIGVVHLNNSYSTYGSRRDRHEALDKGKIPLDDLLELATDFNKSTYRPIILETPGATIYSDFALCKEALKI